MKEGAVEGALRDILVLLLLWMFLLFLKATLAKLRRIVYVCNQK